MPDPTRADADHTDLYLTLPTDLVARLDGMVDTLTRYSAVSRFGVVDRGFVVRMAIVTGLDALDREYGEPTVGASSPIRR